MRSFMELAGERESCRRYAAKPVEREKLEACVRAACLSPSACNSQPWKFTVVRRSDLLPEVSACVQQYGINAYTVDCPVFVVVTEEKARLISRLSGVVDSQHFAQMDIGLAAAHFCLEAADVGLGACILGVFDEERLKALLGIAGESRVRLVLAVGYPADGEPRPKVRKPEEETVCFVE